MDIRQLHTEDLRYTVPSVHPRLAVIKATSDQRAALLGAQVLAHVDRVGRRQADAAVLADAQSRQAAHERAVETQQDTVARATAALEHATTSEVASSTRRLAAAEALVGFDTLAAGAIEAQTSRDEAWTDRRRALSHLGDAVDQLERVRLQRGEAAATLRLAEAHVANNRLQARPTESGSAEPVQELLLHVAAVHAALDKAEASRQSDVAIATEELLSAMTGVNMGEAEVSRIWAMLRQTIPQKLLERWGQGLVEPGMLAEHRTSLVAVEAAAGEDHSRTGAAAVDARRHRDEEALRFDELASTTAEQARTGEALAAWLTDVALHLDHDGTNGALALDDVFGGVDASVRAGLLDTLVALSANTQLLYLTDQLDVVAWAISLPDDIGGLNYVATAEPHVHDLND